MKKRLTVIALVFALLMTFPLVAYADSGLPQEDVSERTSWEKNEEADEKYAPRVVTMDNGVQVQKTPFNDVALDTQAGDVESKTIASWNNYFLPSLLLTKAEKKTVPIMIAQLRSADYSKFDMGKVYMFILLAILPVLVVYIILSKSIIKGVTAGSVKG
mgnify:CR=1 FL=1